MKSAVIATLVLAPLCAQQPSPVVQVAPGTPAIGAPQAAPAPATPPAPIKPDTVIMEANGKKYTAAEVDHLIALLPPQYQGAAKSQPQAATQLLRQVLFYQQLAEDAVKNEYDKRSPYKEQIEFARINILANVEIMLHHNSVVVKEDDRQKYYKDHPEKFQEADIRVIRVDFNPTTKAVPGSKQLPSEAEAKAKIEDLRKQIVAGGDFGKLARENSDDAQSAAKDGAFGTIKRGSAYPEAIKTAIFALKPGEMSLPIRQPSGFWLIRVEEVRSQPYAEVSDQIETDIKQEQFQNWQNSGLAQYNVKIENPAYFTPQAPPAQLQQVR